MSVSLCSVSSGHGGTIIPGAARPGDKLTPRMADASLVQDAVVWLTGAAAVAVIGNQIRSFIQGFKEQPPADQKYQTKERCEQFYRENGDRIRRIEDRLDESRDSREIDRNKLGDELEQLRKNVQEDIREVHGRIDGVNATLGEIPARVIAILSNTGALKK